MKILIITSRLDFGGAETHILTLSCELVARGHTVHLISEGGAFAQAFEGSVLHYAPLDRKSPLALIRSVAALRSLQNREHFDVMHAHSRIGAFAATLAGFKRILCTTFHWVFKSTFPYSLLTCTGRRVLAVSPDIKRYVIDNYRTPPDKITVTVNGIDTVLFSPGKRAKTSVHILHTSRLSADRSLCARMLISVSTRLARRFPNILIDIVGDGEELEELILLANLANREAGRTVITMHGARRDTHAFAAMADIFVGVSRAALEAMSCGCAAVLCGNEGYLSIFQAQEPLGETDNFCARTGVRPSEEQLLADLSYLISLDKRELHAMGAVNREYVQTHYSKERMADDALAAYSALCPSSRRRAVVCGYYGEGNFGDDLTLFSLISYLRDNGYGDITILCRKTKKVSNIYCVSTVNKYNLYKVRRRLARADAFYLGGGNLLQNKTSNRSLLYYARVFAIAMKEGARRIIISSGIGELRGRWAIDVARTVLHSSDIIRLRTSGDIDAARTLLADEPEVRDRISYMPDLAASCPLPDMSYYRPPISERKYFIVTAGAGLDIQSIGRIADTMPCIIVPLFEHRDLPYAKQLARKIKNARLVSPHSVFETVYLIEKAELCICTRLHALIIALYRGTPAATPSQLPEKSRFFLNDARICAERHGIDFSSVYTDDLSRAHLLSRKAASRLAAKLPKLK